MKKLVIGILAHVDAGKTTLAESILYLTGSIRKLGRVDHKNAFLDTYELERSRGITIFSKQAKFAYKDIDITLLDTPGHVDFSAEMERTFQVMDYAILVISGSDGVQGHTETLWRLLARYKVPTFLFINKMDLDGTDRTSLIRELKKELNDGCMDFNTDQNQTVFMENLAMCDETLLEQYMDHGVISTEDIAELIATRKIFPCYFGSALKLEGVDVFLNGLEQYTKSIPYSDEFGAKIYKITRDDQGKRLTYMKITGGSLKVKMLLSNQKAEDKSLEEGRNTVWEEKVDQIRIYSGTRYEALEEAQAGTVCAVTGLSHTYPGEGLGSEAIADMPLLEPVLTYRIILPPEIDPHTMLMKLRQLEEEDPLLHIVWSKQLKEIHIKLMGEVQIEVLKSVIFERFGMRVEFSSGNIVYKETIKEPVVGMGHFEPLRHYAEVHLLLEPGEAGSGLVFASTCSEDILDRNWQRLILTHLEEKEHVGVLTGSPITDMKITLITGRAHQKHTEGGDFRQATYRAVRQGLKRAKSVLLEPYYQYKLEVPAEAIGRAMSDIQRMSGSFELPQIHGDTSILTGSAPAAVMREYQTEVSAYTKGRGKLFCTLKGYEPCHNADEVIEAIGYHSDQDLENPAGSVFCAHGAGFLVEWNMVEEYIHIDNGFKETRQDNIKGDRIYQYENPIQNRNIITKGFTREEEKEEKNIPVGRKEEDKKEKNPVSMKDSSLKGKPNNSYGGSLQEEKELEAIFVRTFGPFKQKAGASQGLLGYEKKAARNAQTKLNLKELDSKGIAAIEKSSKNREIRQGEFKDTDAKSKGKRQEYLLVDGYNIIFSWEELNELAKMNIDAARNKLMDILCNYQGFTNCSLILVFDAYKVKGGVGEIFDYHNIHVVYTKEAETADQYIEKVTHEIAKEYPVKVATSDALEQLIILGQGAARLSANDLKEEILRVRGQIRRDYLDKQLTGRAYLKEQFNADVLDILNE